MCGCEDDKREREKKEEEEEPYYYYTQSVQKRKTSTTKTTAGSTTTTEREREGTFLLAREILNDGFARRILLPQRRFGFSNRERERETIGGGVFV